MVLTEIGEVGIHQGDRDILLRPSLYSISKLGSPVEIVELFYRVVDGSKPKVFKRDGELIETGTDSYLMDCITVLWSCTEEDISDITGYSDDDGINYGSMPKQEMALIAQHLMIHGVIGIMVNPEKDNKKSGGSYSKEFKAIEYVSTAIAHLGISERDAWGMTMTGLVNALRSKYPPEKSKGGTIELPTDEELKSASDFHDQVKAIRVAKERAKNGY